MVKTIFFCFGIAKSGTTLLQRSLNLHPEVSCPSEHQLTTLGKDLVEVLNRYNNLLQVIDTRTGSQGANLVSQSALNKIIRHTFLDIIIDSAAGKPIAGINDNKIHVYLDLFNSMFDKPKMIAIFRNPMSSGISAWHHNLRLAEKENDPTHTKLVERYGDFHGWMVHYAQIFNESAERCQEFRSKNENFILVRYEDLVSNKKEELRKIFGHLGAKITDEILDKIVFETDFDRMRNSSSDPEFFRSGRVDEGEEKLEDKTRNAMIEVSKESLLALGYKT